MKTALHLEGSRASAVTSAPRTAGYLRFLFALLMSATVFEGYDITIFHLCTPDIARTFAMGDPAVGAMASVVRIGGMLSFFFVLLADRFGRKPILSVTVLCYTAFTLLTALSSGVVTFTLFQSAAQVFLAAEFGVAVTMIGEEFPDDKRGRAIAGLHMVAFLGVTVAGLVYGAMSGSRWGWRGMYALGVVPLVLVAFLRRGLKETARFTALQHAREASGKPRAALAESLRTTFRQFLGPYRARLLVVAGLWNSLGLIGGPTVTYFSLYARRDHGWTSDQLGTTIILAYLGGIVGSMLSGVLMDRIGRRLTAAGAYLLAAAAMFALFRSDDHTAILIAEIVTMSAYQAARTATSALSTELFPTEIRATGYSLTVQVIGQVFWMLSPVAIGLLAGPLGGLGNAASWFAIGPLFGVVLLLFVPETRGRSLEETGAHAAAAH
jgi:putative MFS transporter